MKESDYVIEDNQPSFEATGTQFMIPKLLPSMYLREHAPK